MRAGAGNMRERIIKAVRQTLDREAKDSRVPEMVPPPDARRANLGCAPQAAGTHSLIPDAARGIALPG
jgi:hypothetical protein